MVASSWHPLVVLETTPLVLSRPWTSLWETLLPQAERISVPEQALPEEVTNAEKPLFASSSIDWWTPILPPPEKVRDFVAIGLNRLQIQNSSSSQRPRYLGGPALPIQEGDPVVCGLTLVGFVHEVNAATLIQVYLLDDSRSRLIVGSVRGTVAGESIQFVVGGPSPDLTGGIQVQFPSSRFGLQPGTRAYTGENPLTTQVPADFLIGEMVVLEPKVGEMMERVAINPALPRSAMNRVAVLVPRSRLEGQSLPKTVPELQFEPIAVKVSPWLDRSGRRAVMHLHGGIEKGLSQGDLVVVNGFVLGRIQRVGLLGSSAIPLFTRGQSLVAAYEQSNGQSAGFSLQILACDGLQYRARANPMPPDLAPGTRLFVDAQPCSGLGKYPSLMVEEITEEDALILRAPWPVKERAGICIRFQGSA